MNLQGATVDVGVKISELNTSSTTTAASKVVDMEFYVDNARRVAAEFREKLRLGFGKWAMHRPMMAV